MSRGRKRLLLMAFILALSCVAVLAVAIGIVWQIHLRETKLRLVSTAHSQATLINSIAVFDREFSQMYPGGAADATLAQILHAQDSYGVSSSSEEILLGQRENNRIVFTVGHNHDNVDLPDPVDFNSTNAEPMRRALMGQSGTVIGLDYHGDMVIAAFEPVGELSMGLVAKIDLAEVRAPFIKAGTLAGLISIVIVVLSAVLQYKTASPMIRRLESHSRDLEREVKERKTAEQALKESTGLLREAQDVAQLGTYKLISENGTWESSKVLDNLFGIGFEFRRDIDGWVSLLHPEDREMMVEYFQQNILTDHEQFDKEYRIIRENDKEERWVHGLGTLELDDSGNVTSMIGTIQDITERKLAENELVMSENKYRSLIESVQAIPWKLDLGTQKFTYMGKQVEEALGYPAESWTDIQVWKERIHAGDRERAFEYCLARTEKGQDHSFEYRATKADGSTVYIRDIVSVICEDGIPTELVGFLQDITESRQAQARTLLLSQITEQVRDAIITTDLDFKITYANQSFKDLYGYTLSELKGKTPDMFNAEEVSDQIQQEIYQTVNSGKSWQGVILNRRKDGSTFDCESLIFPLIDKTGSAFAFAGAQRDISARKKVENDLLASETRIRAILEAQPDLMFIISAEGQHLDYYSPNPEILFADPDEIIGKSVNDLLPDDVAREYQNVIQQTLSTRSTQAFEYQLDFPDGTNHSYEARMVSLDDSRVLAIVRDVSKRRQAEADKLQLETQMRQNQKLESIGTLAGGVAHEINNPITGILNYAQVIIDETTPETIANEYAKEIIAESDRIAQIVRNLLTFARDEKQSHSPALLSDIVDKTMSLIRTLMRHDQITLMVDVPETLPKFNCRSQQIQQVLMNLVINARDALNEKYPEYDDNKTISIHSEEFFKDTKPWLRTVVTDQGTGIPPQIQDKIFDPFFTTKGREVGTGLGLSISHGIVTDHHGELRMESESGKGTSFILELPVDNGWQLNTADESKG